MTDLQKAVERVRADMAKSARFRGAGSSRIGCVVGEDDLRLILDALPKGDGVWVPRETTPEMIEAKLARAVEALKEISGNPVSFSHAGAQRATTTLQAIREGR